MSASLTSYSPPPLAASATALWRSGGLWVAVAGAVTKATNRVAVKAAQANTADTRRRLDMAVRTTAGDGARMLEPEQL